MSAHAPQHFPYPDNKTANMALGQLLTNHIRNRRILRAMTAIPREPFLPEHLRGAAYVDEDMEIAPGRWLMEPLTFARLLQLAAITPGCRVLVIGALNGYAAAVLAKLAAHVTATDTDTALLDQALAHFSRWRITNAHARHVASLTEGYPPGAPYDAIVMHGAVDVIPESIGAQLAIGGRLVAVRRIARRPDAPMGLGKGMLVEKIDGRLQSHDFFDAAAVLLPGFAHEAVFTF